MNGNDKSTIKSVMSWKPTGKRPRGWPRKGGWMRSKRIWKGIEVINWRNIIHDREKWR